MLKSLCKVTFEMYQGGLLHPHSSIPYVQTGFIIVFYMVILFSRDSCDFLFISQFIFLILSSNCLLLAFICVCHVSFRRGEVLNI
jgi:hypothetical protein